MHSQVIGSDEDNSTTTLVHVSWNGATEVAFWNLYKTDDMGNTDSHRPVITLPRMGFETALSYKGFASFVVAEAVDSNGTSLGRSEVTRTIASAKLSSMTVAQESEWLGRVNQRNRLAPRAAGFMYALYVNPTITFASGLSCGVVLMVSWRAFWRSRRARSLLRARRDSILSIESEKLLRKMSR